MANRAEADQVPFPRVSDRSPTSRRNPLPEGTLAIGAGLIIAGLSAYGFLSVSRRALGEDDFASISLLWFTTFILAPGFFLPVEQEVGRALAHRRALGQGGLPVARKAAGLGLGLVLGIGSIILVLSPWLANELFHGYWSLVGCLLLSFVTYATAHFTRGVFAGSGRFGPYGVVMGAEGVIRLVLSVALFVAGVEAVGLYGLLVGIPPLVAVAVALRRQRLRGPQGLLQDGPPAAWAEISQNLGWLLAGSALMAALLNAGPLAASLLAGEDDRALVSEFAAGVLIARVPLFLFQAVQAALLPKLARLAAQGQISEFVVGFRRLMAVVVSVGVVGVSGAFLLGPWAVEVFFTEELSRRTLTLLALSSALYMVALAMAQAIIALQGHARVALGWLVGMVAFVTVTALSASDLLLRVELGLVAGSGAAAASFALSLRSRLRRRLPAITEASVIEAMVEAPMEP